MQTLAARPSGATVRGLAQVVPPAGAPGHPRWPRVLAVTGFLAAGSAFIALGLHTPRSCTRTTTTTRAAASGGRPSVKTVTACGSTALTDPPLAALGIVMLLLAVPALGLSEVDFAGLSIKKTAAQAAQAAAQASGAADRAATAALTAATASSRAQAHGNVVNVVGTFDGSATNLDDTEAGLAFTLGASGIVSAIIGRVPGVVDASVLWLDRATDTLRPHAGTGPAGADARGPLGDVVRRAVPAIFDLEAPAELGLTKVDGPVRAMAVPTRHAPRPAVGMLLLALGPGHDPSPVLEAVDPYFARPAALLIERLTKAGAQAGTIASGGAP